MEFLSTPPTEMKTLGYINEQFGVDESAGIVLKNDQNELATITMTFHAKLPKRGVIAFEGAISKLIITRGQIASPSPRRKGRLNIIKPANPVKHSKRK